MRAHLKDRHPRWQDHIASRERLAFEESISVSAAEEIALEVSEPSENGLTT